MRRKLLMVIPVLALLGSGFGFAASLGVSGVDNLGSGTEVVSPPAIEVAHVGWTINHADYSVVYSVSVTMQSTDGEYHEVYLYLILKDDTDAVIRQHATLTYNVGPIPEPYNWVLNPPGVLAADIAVFAITVIEAVP